MGNSKLFGGFSMQKWLTTLLSLIIVSMMILVAAPAQAQSPVTFASVDVSLMPEYDRSSVLVIYDFVASQTATFPFSVTIRIPEKADLLAVAYLESGSFLNAPYDATQVADGWRLVQFTIENPVGYRIEYYDDYQKDGNTRTYRYEWAGDAEVQRFQLTFQQPRGARNTTTNPDLGAGIMNAEGLTEYGTLFNNLANGQTISLDIQYEKDNDDLTVTGSSIQPTTPLTPEPVGLNLNTILPWILGGMGALLIIGGIVYFWITGRQAAEPARKRHTASHQGEEAGEGNVYCHECGKRAQPSDRFCRTCGTRLRS
jgi:hypothetical protein